MEDAWGGAVEILSAFLLEGIWGGVNIVDDEADARFKFSNLSQRKDSVEDYTVKFNLPRAQSGILKDVALAELYIQGLSSKILE